MSPNKLLRNLTSPGFGFGPTKLQRCLRLIRQRATLAVAMYVCVYIYIYTYIHIYIKHAQTSCGFARLGFAKNPKVSSALETPCRRAKSSHHADLLKGFGDVFFSTLNHVLVHPPCFFQPPTCSN